MKFIVVKMIQQKGSKDGKQFLMRRLSKVDEVNTVFENYLEAEAYSEELTAHVIKESDFSLWMTKKELVKKVLLAYGEASGLTKEESLQDMQHE